MFNKLKQFKELRDQAKQVQNELSQVIVASEAWSGKIQISMDGTQHITGISIAPDILNPDNQHKIESELQHCFNDCVKKVQKAMVERMRNGNLKLPDIPSSFA